MNTLQEKIEQQAKLKVDKVILHNLEKLVTFPTGIVKYQAINVYDNKWRVNLWTVGDNNARVESSWFVEAAHDGEVVRFV